MRAWTTRNEVGTRFRTAIVSRLSVMAVATLSYVVLVFGFLSGYEPDGSGFAPTADAINAFLPRYIDWSVTVPLLTVELLAVCTLVGQVARRTRAIAVALAFLMIFTGFIGAFVVDDGRNLEALVVWGAISAVFWIATNVVLIGAVRRSLPQLTPEEAGLIKRATVILLGGWIIYPVVYLIPLLGMSGGATTTMQLALCAADVLVKVGFGGHIHRIAKLRTAEDVRAGDDIHAESIWISSEKQSDAGSAREVYLADGAAAHLRRVRPPMTFATTEDASALGDQRELDLDDV
ncbi:bacteriorhodopsin [Agreia sp. COWG]|uniref:bacteriorhodopsin n=1 Tax=Agreia sp. COWG TaxID=2773266 RepID=UPI00351C22E8